MKSQASMIPRQLIPGVKQRLCCVLLCEKGYWRSNSKKNSGNALASPLVMHQVIRLLCLTYRYHKTYFTKEYLIIATIAKDEQKVILM